VRSVLLYNIETQVLDPLKGPVQAGLVSARTVQRPILGFPEPVDPVTFSTHRRFP
jgi:hypothetical protein